jgi:hypothetical protein
MFGTNLPRLLRRAVATLLVAAPTALFAQRNPTNAPRFPTASILESPGKDVSVSLLTMGNGDLVWELFGHTAIRIHNNVTGQDSVFNWGVFDSRQPNFILHFLQGLNWYQMGGQTIADVLAFYRYFNRSVTEQDLNLSEAQRDSLVRLIQANARPENLKYRYDYFVDNCATRPRDLLDRVLGGQLRAGADSLTGLSYRGQALRLMQGDKPLVVGVDIGLGEPSDEELTTWKAMFLPRVLHDYVGSLKVRDANGGLQPLVSGERVLFQSTRGPEPTAPPRLWSYLLLLGLFIGVLLLWLASTAGRNRAARWGLGILATLWCTIAGLLGVVLTLLWTVTDHQFAHANENLLVFNPLWLVLAVCVGMYIAGGRAARFTGLLAAFLAGLSVLALLSHAVFVSRQANMAIILLALPPALALAWITWTPAPSKLKARS